MCLRLCSRADMRACVDGVSVLCATESVVVHLRPRPPALDSPLLSAIIEFQKTQVMVIGPHTSIINIMYTDLPKVSAEADTRLWTMVLPRNAAHTR